MNKKELEAKLEQAKYDTEQNVKAVQIAGANEVERIEALIEAKKRPNLKLGDCLYDPDADIFITVIKSLKSQSHKLTTCGSGGLHCGYVEGNEVATRPNTIWIKNTFVELEALKEKVTEFECGDIKISLGDSGCLCVEDTDDMESVKIPERHVGAAIMAIRQMQATHKTSVV